MTSPHAAFRERLAAVDGGRGIVTALIESGAIDGPAADWRQTFGRFAPAGPVWATSLIEARAPQRIVLVEIRAEGPGLPLDGLGRATLGRFPHDRRLPTLGSTIRRSQMTEVIRYRPGLRCTFRSSLGGGSFGKVFADPSVGVRVHADAALLRDASARGSIAFEVAAPLRRDPVTGAILQSRVAGVPVYADLMGPSGEDVARRVGEAAATLARFEGRPALLHDRDVQLAKSRSVAAELARRVPGLASRADGLVERVAAVHAAVPRRPLAPIHGGLHPHQWLDADGRLGLIDFDGLALGEVELDAANFMAEVDFERSAAVGSDRINDAFLAGFERAAGPLDGRLLAAYRAEKRLSKALRSARALRPDGDVAAGRHLDRAHDALQEVT